MPIINRIGEFADDMTAWRRDFHANPEIAFEEERTASVVAEKLRAFGFDEVHTGIAKTGVVGVLRSGNGGSSAIGLRADMDALPIAEANDLPYRSTRPGRMHACGHDGHTTMLLGAARYLAETRNFDGTVYFIFQPAEEQEGGGRVMIEEGLFERFPCQQVYGMHNWPRMPVGMFAMRPGPMMAAADRFKLAFTGAGGHGAMPHASRDPVVAAAHAILALQSIVSRNVDPIAQAVISATQVHAGDTDNVIPEVATVSGTVRSFTPEVRDLLEERILAVGEGVAATFGMTVDGAFERGYPPTVNSADETELAAAAAIEVAGEAQVKRDPPQVMGAEDFAFMLEKVPGSYIFIGNGGGDDAPMVHNPRYNFNDEALPYGASYWAKLVEQRLPAR